MLAAFSGKVSESAYLTALCGCVPRQEILEHLSECVRRHEELQTASRQQAAWLAAQREQLAAADSVSGEPAALQQRRDALQVCKRRPTAQQD